MKNKLLFLLKYYLFWLLLSMMAKVIFLLYQYKESALLETADYWKILTHGLWLDVSLGGYVMMLACVVMAVTPLFRDRVARWIFSFLTMVLLVFFSVVMTTDLELFSNWGFHMDTTPLLYLKNPQQAMASTPVWLIVLLLLLAAAFTAGAWLLFRKVILRPFRYSAGGWWQIPIFLLIGGAMIIPVRGGFNVATLNSNFVYYHPSSMFANQAAVNPVWNFMYELMHINRFQNNYDFMPQERADAVVDSLMMKTDAAYPQLLTTQKPDIVFLLLESFTANAIGVMGGVPGLTPNIDSLAREGVLFSEIYASAGRSDRGLLAAISAFPSHPNVAMISYPNKTVAHPRFPKDLEKEGYATRFYYAGDINFCGFRSYITMSFQGMVTEDDFSGEAIKNRFKWGVHDQYMYERLYEDISEAPRPFLYTAFNLDSHEPFEVPMATRIPGDDSEHKFMNAVYYTDSCIGNFVRQCKASGIWDHTLFVLMADHGVRHIGHLNTTDPAMYRIPLILTGGVMAVKDTVISTIGSQTDMVATLFAQLGLDHSGYRYSRNLLDPGVIPFAFYSYTGAAGVVSEHGVSVYDLRSRDFIQTDSLRRNDELLKAYLQNINRDVVR